MNSYKILKEKYDESKREIEKLKDEIIKLKMQIQVKDYIMSELKKEG